MRLLCLLALLLLAACTTPETPLRKDFTLQTSVIHWVRTTDQETADNICRKLNITATGLDFPYRSGTIAGCAAFDPAAGTCTIYAPMPRFVEDQQRMAIIGHEMVHCFEGYFHR